MKLQLEFKIPAISWKIYGSKNDADWVELGSYDNLINIESTRHSVIEANTRWVRSYVEGGSTTTLALNPDEESYLYYAIVITRVLGSSLPAATLKHLSFNVRLTLEDGYEATASSWLDDRHSPWMPYWKSGSYWQSANSLTARYEAT